MTVKAVSRFRREIYRYYHTDGRRFPWRETEDPYGILVSEYMLQQTQVGRVLEYYEPFIERFPDFETLSRASLAQVLDAWRGLGYNRRAKSLHETARLLIRDHGGALPSRLDLLTGFPGIGRATACAVLAFAFRTPVVFVETNIRRVYLYFYFEGRSGVTDREIMPLVEETLDTGDPRTWYYALMDYGAMLGKKHRGLGRRSAHYTRQAPFEGSDRQVRGRVLRALLDAGPMTGAELARRVGAGDETFRRVISALVDEGMVGRRDGRFGIP